MRDGTNTACIVSLFHSHQTVLRTKTELIGRVVDPQTTTFQHMGMDHRRTAILVPKQPLNGPDIIAVFQ